MAKRILVTGSRDWVDRLTIVHALNQEYEPGAVLIHGGARGADAVAGEYWQWRYSSEPEVHPADWTQHGKKAGYIRNFEMVNAGADICLAFIRDESKGATMCANLAEKAGIPTRRFIA